MSKLIVLLAAVSLFAFAYAAEAAQPVATGGVALRDLQNETGIVLDPSTLPDLLLETPKYNRGPHDWQVRWFIQRPYYRIGLVPRGLLVTDAEIDTYIAKRLMGNPRNPDPVCTKEIAAPPHAFKLVLLEKCTTIINVSRTYYFSVAHFILYEKRYSLFVMDASPRPYDGVHEILLNLLAHIKTVPPKPVN